MTYSVRVITYKSGDLIKTKEGEMMVISINNKFINVQDINSKKYKQLTISELLNNNPILIEQ
jgi:NMD protein affecting ribosome stability and mRNA decay